MITKPQPDEYVSFYAGYVTYAAQYTDIIQLLIQLRDSTHQFINEISTEKENYAYATGKWTVKQLVSHLIDAERIFAYRILRISRKDDTNLAGFDENLFVENADVNKRSLTNMADEFKAVRSANLYLYKSITEEQSLYVGMANNSAITVRALLYIAAGHELHHLNILRERYL
ncbi:DinB family protein [Mucilaginibacter lacusdianchii]|uniref:DinB family protein n=1 Tax=Mucilaginibacter lacusdianchii TaxID=2684211 RepID=UPI001E5248D6|nr:DinB family protein [Mucilaginibacter sp. JXJ CY 39]